MDSLGVGRRGGGELGAESGQGTQEAGMMEGGLSPTRKPASPTLLPQNGGGVQVLIRADTSPVPFPSTSQRAGCHLAPEHHHLANHPQSSPIFLRVCVLMPPPLSRPLLTYQHSFFSLGGRNNVSSGSPLNPQALTWQKLAFEKYLSSE